MKKLLLILTSFILAMSISAQTNLITNPSFETGDLSGWKGYNNDVTSGDAYHGEYKGRIKNDAGAINQINLDLIPGHTYSVSFYAKWPDGTGKVSGINLTVQDMDNGNAKFANTASLSDTAWAMADTIFTVPPKTGQTRIVMYKGNSGTKCFIDTVTLIDLGAIQPAFSVESDGDITEGSEDGEVLTVALLNDVFAATLNSANYLLSDLPAGVIVGSVTRVNDTALTVTLSGNATEDYDSKLEPQLTIKGAEFATYNDDATCGLPITFKAIVEPAPATSLSTDTTETNAGNILEDFEDGRVVTISIHNNDDTFADPLTLSNWELTNFPEGVTIGAAERLNDSTVNITLSGNTTGDYDVDITNAAITIAAEEFVTWNEVVNVKGLNFIATVEGQEILVWEQNFDTIPDGTHLLDSAGRVDYGFFDWENPDSAVVTGGEGMFYTKGAQANFLHIKVPVEGGMTYIFSIDIATTNGSPVEAQVREAASTNFRQKVESATLQTTTIVFAVDPDVDTVWLSIYKYGGADVMFDNMKLFILTEPMIGASSDGEIIEGAEDGEVITVTVTNDDFVASPNAANWTVSGLPAGVSVGSVNRVDDKTIELVLSGNATEDYDVDISNIMVTGHRDEFVTSNKALSTETSITFTAVVEPPEVTLADDGEILEGDEDGEVITVTIANDTIVDPITPSNWTVSNLPAGVSVGEVFRVNDFKVEIVLSGNRSENYDEDITNFSVTIAGSEFTEWGSDITVDTGVTFTAVEETSITINSIQGLRVYPNPVSDLLYVTADNTISSIEVSNILGATIFVIDNNGSRLNTIETGEWNSGVYMIQITDNEGNKELFKVVK